MWKILWQGLFFFSIIMFVLIFIKFSKGGYKDLKKMLNK